MPESQRAVLTRLSDEFAAMSRQMAKVSATLTQLDLSVLVSTNAAPEAAEATPRPDAAPPPVAATAPWTPTPASLPAPYLAPNQTYSAPQTYAPTHIYTPTQTYTARPASSPPAHWAPPPGYVPPPPRIPQPSRSTRDPEQGWIGKALAVAGVAVTLIGVVLLLVLAAQAGILRPELRVVTGAALAGALVGVGIRMHSRPGGRIGAIALAATGIAAAYMDVLAVTSIYHYVAQPVGLVAAALVGGAGLTLARRWDSQHLAVLVLVPLTVLAPIITDGVNLLLVGFMLALSAAALPVQLGKDWTGMHAARTAAATLPLLVALAAAVFGTDDDPLLLGGACGVAALLAIAGALLLLPSTTNRVGVALVTVGGVVPVLAAPVAVERWPAALLTATLSACLLVIVLFRDRLPGVTGAVAHVWSALAAVSGLLAVTAAFRGPVVAPVLLAVATTIAIAGRSDIVARWVAIGFAAVGGMAFLNYAPPLTLSTATPLSPATAASTLAASVLLAVCAAAVAWSWVGTEVDESGARALWISAGTVLIYAVTVFTVTTGVLIGGPDGGFLAGHMAATICWIVLAAGLFRYALQARHRDRRAAPIAGGLALTAAAMAKLFLFDLATLDGIFRVVVFIVVGLILLAMGTGYARSLAARDGQGGREDRQPPAAVHG